MKYMYIAIFRRIGARFLLLFLSICVCAYGVMRADGAGIRINEIMASNGATITDEDGDYPDWIELYNAGSAAVNLTDWGLSDRSDAPFKWRFGSVTVSPGEYIIVWASGKDRPSGTHIHTSWSVSSAGEEIVLTAPDGTRHDYVAATPIPRDISYGRYPDGTGTWYYFSSPTPGSANTTPRFDSVLSPPEYSSAGGMYHASVTVALHTAESGAEIRYTVDGSTPTQESPLYTTPFVLESRAGTPNDISLIPTNEQAVGPPYLEGWEPPEGEVFKIHTLRTRTFRAGSLPSLPVTHSYLIDNAGAERYSFPVVSIATDRENLFDNDYGIYVRGWHDNYFQRGRAWERDGTVEFFTEDGVRQFFTRVGIRIHGGTTRNRPRKTLRIYAREPSTFTYQLFPDKPIEKFDTFLLRNSGNDWGHAIFRDAFIQSLADATELDRQYSRPVVVFINGEYWGIHMLRDRFDDGYIAHHYGLSDREFTQLEVRSGAPSYSYPSYDRGEPSLVADYHDIIDDVTDNGVVSSARYAAVQSRIDIESFIDLFHAHIFCGNTDWPGNNVRIWRSVAEDTSPLAPYRHDGKWRYMLFDTDFGFGLDFFYIPGHDEWPIHNTLAFAASPHETHWANNHNATILFRRLLQNATFRQTFVTRFSDQLNTSYSVAHVTNRLAYFVDTLQPEMAEHVHRWRQPYTWEDEVTRMREYLYARTDAVWGHLQSFFSLGERHTLTVDVTDDARGMVRVNTRDLVATAPDISSPVYPWQGTYFTDYPVRLQAFPTPGNHFVGWYTTHSATDGEDASDNYPSGSDWYNGSNGGSGFSSWELESSSSPHSGFFMGASGRAIHSHSPDGRSFGIYAHSDQWAWAARSFADGPLAVGQSFSLLLGMDWFDGQKGIILTDSAAERYEFRAERVGGNDTYRVRANGDAFTSLNAVFAPESDAVFSFTVTRLDQTEYRITLTRDDIVHHDTVTLQGDVRGFRLYNQYTSGSQDGNNLYFNRMKLRSGTGAYHRVSDASQYDVTLTEDVAYRAAFAPSALLHYWSFNTVDTLLDPTYTYNAGMLSVDEGAATEVTHGTGQSFTGENARLGEDAGAHLRVNNPLGSSLILSAPTEGYDAIHVAYEARRSGQGAGEQTLSYTTNGTDWIAARTYAVHNASPLLIEVDFSDTAGVADNAAFGLRITFAQGEGGTAGNVRFDNITVSGAPRPGVTPPARVEQHIALQKVTEDDAGDSIDLTHIFASSEEAVLSFSAYAHHPAKAAAQIAGDTITLVPVERGDAHITVYADDGHNPPVPTRFRVLVYPGAHALAHDAYAFTTWAATEAAGRFPPHMLFVQGQENDSSLTTPFLYSYHIPSDDAAESADVDYPYAATARTRINGLGNDGVSFINTGRGRDLGGALLAVDTRGMTNAYVSWLSGTILTNQRVYALRLQYRVGFTGAFMTVTDTHGQPVEYLRNAQAGHTAMVGPISLPSAALDKEYVQLLWRYYRVSGVSGPRAELRLDSILVTDGTQPAATELVYETPPPHMWESSCILPPLIVHAVTSYGITDTEFTEAVILTRSGESALHGAVSVQAVDGIATFTNIYFVGDGTNVLHAHSGALTPVDGAIRILPEGHAPVFIPGGDGEWAYDNNWTRATYPHGSDAHAYIYQPEAGHRMIHIGVPVTIGNVRVSHGATPYRTRIGASDAANAFTFMSDADHASLIIEGEGSGWCEYDSEADSVLAKDLHVHVHNVVGHEEYGALRLRRTWTGAGGIVKTGAGVMSLTGSGKMYTGATIISQGVVRVTEPAAPVNTAGVHVYAGGQLRLVSGGDIRTYDFGGTLHLQGLGRDDMGTGEGYGIRGALRYDPGSNDDHARVLTDIHLDALSGIHVDGTRNRLTLLGALAGEAALIQTGGGVLALAGDSPAYSGEIHVSNGVLMVNGELSAATRISAVDGSVLGGSGMIGDADVEKGAVIAPGESIGVLTTGALTLHTGSAYHWEYTPDTSDSIDAGTLKLPAVANSVTVSLFCVDTSVMYPVTYPLFRYSGTAPNIESLYIDISDASVSHLEPPFITDEGGMISITLVPEPGGVVVFIGLTLLLRARACFAEKGD